MQTSHWQPFNVVLNPLKQVQSELNRVFEHWAGDRRNGSAAAPLLNVWEESDALFVEAELPGLDVAGLEVLVTGGNQLHLKGERKRPVVEKGLWHRQERGFGAFSRSLTLPFPVDSDKVEARYDKGVLTVRLAKHESAKPRKITVKAD